VDKNSPWLNSPPMFDTDELEFDIYIEDMSEIYEF